MFCLIHRWKIDRALDDNQELPRSTKTHIANCPPVTITNNRQSSLSNLSNLLQHQKPHRSCGRVLSMPCSPRPRTEPTLSVPVWVPIAACAVIAFFSTLELPLCHPLRSTHSSRKATRATFCESTGS